jgi:hypothetical protein
VYQIEKDEIAKEAALKANIFELFTDFLRPIKPVADRGTKHAAPRGPTAGLRFIWVQTQPTRQPYATIVFFSEENAFHF